MRNKWIRHLTLAGLLLKFLPVFAADRVLPRSDYGQGGFFPPYNWIMDRVSALTEYDEDFTMGGNRDLLFQVSGDVQNAEVFACPSLRPCLDGPVDQVKNCKQDISYWACDMIYSGPIETMCDRFQRKFVGTTLTDMVVNGLIGSAVEYPITFLNTGIIGDINQALGVWSAIVTLWTTAHVSCETDGVGSALAKAASPDLYLMRETEKLDVTNAISIFEFPSNDFRYLTDAEDAAQVLSLGGAVQPVILDPAHVTDGRVQYVSNGPLRRIWTMKKDCIPTDPNAPYDCENDNIGE